jgi:hypothetical protein
LCVCNSSELLGKEHVEGTCPLVYPTVTASDAWHPVAVCESLSVCGAGGNAVVCGSSIVSAGGMDRIR